MRKTALSALGLVAVLSVPAVAVGTPGPFAGAVRPGESKTHLYDNNPTKSDCVQLAVRYTVSLAYAPPTDTLTLEAGGQTATGSNGAAGVSFWGGSCTSFAVTVTGTSVANAAGYVVTVSTGPSISE